jgi:excisionase family DNA binding protein
MPKSKQPKGLPQPKQPKRTHYGVKELAGSAGVSPGFVRKLIARREITATKIRRRVLIPAEAWQAYLDRNTVPARQ